MTEPPSSSSSITEVALKQALTERLKATHVEVLDESGGCGQAFTCTIVSPEFSGLRVLARNRKVNAAMKDEIALIHAWSAKCKTPEEWAKETGATAAAPQPPQSDLAAAASGSAT